MLFHEKNMLFSLILGNVTYQNQNELFPDYALYLFELDNSNQWIRAESDWGNTNHAGSWLILCRVLKSNQLSKQSTWPTTNWNPILKLKLIIKECVLITNSNKF